MARLSSTVINGDLKITGQLNGVSVKDIVNSTNYNVVTGTSNGLMSKEDKIKLDTIEENANNYTHPSSHEATMITQDASHRFVTDTEKSTWNAKADTDLATTTAAGLMSKDDKVKLNGIATGANKYDDTALKTRITTLETNVSSLETTVSSHTSSISNKVDKVSGKGLSTNDYTSTEKTKLSGIATGATKVESSDTNGNIKINGIETIIYTQPELTKSDVTTALGYTPPTTNTTYSNMTGATSSAAGKSGLVPAPAAGKQTSFLRGDGTWVVPTNTTYSVATESANGLMSKEDKVKLNDIAEGANNYSLPTASSSTLGGIKVGTNLSITDGVLSAKDTTYSEATTSANGLMSSTDKSKLDGIATGANKYTLPTASSTSLGGIKVGTNLTITDGVLSAKDTTYNVASTSANGLMSSTDKSKLDGIATGANKYTLPTASSSTLGGIKVGTNLTITDGVLSAKDTTYSNMTGATSSAAGKSGLVPAPAAGNNDEYLRGDGTWNNPLDLVITEMPQQLQEWVAGKGLEPPMPYSPSDSELKEYVESFGLASLLSKWVNNGTILKIPGIESSADRRSYYNKMYYVNYNVVYNNGNYRPVNYVFKELSTSSTITVQPVTGTWTYPVKVDTSFYISYDSQTGTWRWNSNAWYDESDAVACFTGDTEVLTNSGLKPISEIKVGDDVLSYNYRTGQQEFRGVDKLITHEVDEIYKITLSNGNIIQSSWSHPFWLMDNGKTLAKDLKSGDILTTYKKEQIKIKSVKVIKETTTVHEIRVLDTHSYYVGKDSVLIYNEESIFKEE